MATTRMKAEKKASYVLVVQGPISARMMVQAQVFTVEEFHPQAAGQIPGVDEIIAQSVAGMWMSSITHRRTTPLKNESVLLIEFFTSKRAANAVADLWLKLNGSCSPSTITELAYKAAFGEPRNDRAPAVAGGTKRGIGILFTELRPKGVTLHFSPAARGKAEQVVLTVRAQLKIGGRFQEVVKEVSSQAHTSAEALTQALLGIRSFA